MKSLLRSLNYPQRYHSLYKKPIIRFYSSFSAPPFSFGKTEAQEIFKEWAQEKILTPNNWKNIGQIKACFVPFWIFTFSAKVIFTARLKSKQSQITLENIKTNILSFDSLPCYASTTWERSMLQTAAERVDWNSLPLQQFAYQKNEYEIDMYTLDEETAFKILYQTQLQQKVQQSCKEYLIKNYPGYDTYDVDSNSISLQFVKPMKQSSQEIHSPFSQASSNLDKNIQHSLIYYPFFILENQFRGHDFHCYLNGRLKNNLAVIGYRQYSFSKITTIASAIANSLLLAMTSLNMVQYSQIHLLPYLLYSIGLPALIGFYCSVYPIIRKLKLETDKKELEKNIYKIQREQNQQQQQQYQEQQYSQQKTEYKTSSTTTTTTSLDKEIKDGIDYYTILGLNPQMRDQYTKEQIRSNYRKMAFQYHPDLNQNSPFATDRFKQINQAYDVLSDSKQRLLYHEYGREFVKVVKQEHGQT